MKQTKILLILALIAQCFIATAQVQDAETIESLKKLKHAESEMNDVFSKILVMYKGDNVFIKNIKESQDIWTKFRAAELKAKFPERSPGAYGDVYQMCVNDFLREMTVERIGKLKVWIAGTYEGDVCSGSVRIN